MIQRKIETKFRQLMADFPVVTIYGPRQAGKTTLARMCYPHYNYANLEDMETRRLAERDVKTFFLRHPEPLIIDEIQRVPSLTSAIQVLVDSDRMKRGRFILTGSHQPGLVASVSQTLAGRTALLTLLPLSVAELESAGQVHTTDSLLHRGFMPELAIFPSSAEDYYKAYFRLYVERDLRALTEIRNLAQFERFVVLLAGRIGQPVNLSALSGETGVSVPTMTEWLSILEASFIIFRLQPWFTNITKRFTKTPKLYFIEPGLAAHLLGIETPEMLMRDPLRGHLFENMVVVNALKELLNQGRDPKLFFHKTEKNFEIDLLVQRGRTLRPIEIKSAMTFNFDFTRNLQSFMNKVPEAVEPTLVYDGDPLALSNGISVKNFREPLV